MCALFAVAWVAYILPVNILVREGGVCLQIVLYKHLNIAYLARENNLRRISLYLIYIKLYEFTMCSSEDMENQESNSQNKCSINWIVIYTTKLALVSIFNLL